MHVITICSMNGKARACVFVDTPHVLILRRIHSSMTLRNAFGEHVTLTVGTFEDLSVGNYVKGCNGMLFAVVGGEG